MFLALDPAKHTSGAAIISPDYGNGLLGEEEHPFEGGYILNEYGKVETQPERERYLESLLEIGMELGIPMVVVAEEWDPPRNKKLRLPGNQTGFLMDPKWTYTTVLGIGEGWGRWSAEIESASLFLKEDHKLPALPVERFTPNDWRDELWGGQRARDTEALKETACRYFEGVFGFKTPPDVSEAGCIGLCATRSPRVASAVQEWLKGVPKPKSKSKKKQERRKRRAS